MTVMPHPLSHRLAERLRKALQGEVLFDAFSRGRYATDASHYQIEPVGVVVPRTDDDVRAALAIAREEGVPLLPRGGGTSQSGQTVGRALVLDLSKHLKRIVALDPEARTCTVEPGIVLDDLNRQLKSTGLWFPVDVSTASRATIGGMAGNNSCGTRSIRYGIMRDNVLAIDALLADGTEARFGEVGHNLSQLAPTGSPSPWGRGTRRRKRGRTPQRSRRRAVPRPPRPRPARGGAHRARLPRGVAPRRRVPDRRARARRRAGQSGHAAVRLGGHARRLAPHRAEALAAPQEQGARHLPLRHLPQGHGGHPAHRQARAGGGGGGGPHADRAGPRHRHVPPRDGNLRARRSRRAAARRVRRGRPGREPAPARAPRRADGRSRPPQQRGEGAGCGRPEGGVGGARLGPQHHDVDEVRGKARVLHRGLCGAAGAPRRLHRAPRRHLRQARHARHLLRPCLGRLPARAARAQSQAGARRPHHARHRRGGVRHGESVQGLALRRARRRPGALRVP